MNLAALGETMGIAGGVVLMLLAVAASISLGFLLFISPLLIWLNIRRLRLDLHADLTALRESMERLSGVQEVEAVVEQPLEPAPEDAAAPQASSAPQQADKIGFSCPECGKFFEGPSSLTGTNFTCPECRVEFHIH